MADLSIQIRDYIEATAPAVETERVVQAPDRLAGAPRQVPGWMAAIGATAAILLAIGIPAAFMLRGEGVDVAAAPPTAVAPSIAVAPSTIVSPATTVPPATTVAPSTPTSGTWARLDHDVGANDLALTQLGLVAAGSGGAWFSDDGITWVQKLSLPSDPEGTSAHVDKVIGLGDGVVAVGTRVHNGDGTPLGTEETVAWSTVDGFEWVETVLHTSTRPRGVYVYDVFDANAGLTVAGYEYSDDEAEGERGTSLWRSTDGETWTYSPFEETGLQGVWFTDVAPIGDGYITVATDGSVWASVNEVTVDADGSVWTADNALVWEPVPGAREVLGGLFIAGFADLSGEILAIGQPDIYTGDEVAIWSTPDGGITWDKIEPVPDAFPQLGVTDVTSGTYGVLVAGIADLGAEVWTSVDGRTWQVIADPDGLIAGADIWQLAQLGDSIVAIGTSTVWLWTPDSG